MQTPCTGEPHHLNTRDEARRKLGISLRSLDMKIANGEIEVVRPMGLRRVFVTNSEIQRTILLGVQAVTAKMLQAKDRRSSDE